MSIEQYRAFLHYAPSRMFDLKRELHDLQIDVAPDCKSARVETRQFRTYKMDMITVIMTANYLLEGKDVSNIDRRVTIKAEDQISTVFEYRGGKPFITQTRLKVIKMELI